MSKDVKSVIDEFQQVINMTPKELESWLDTDESKEVHRHLAQRPSGDIEDTPWRYSLKNWGHDPLK